MTTGYVDNVTDDEVNVHVLGQQITLHPGTNALPRETLRELGREHRWLYTSGRLRGVKRCDLPLAAALVAVRHAPIARVRELLAAFGDSAAMRAAAAQRLRELEQ